MAVTPPVWNVPTTGGADGDVAASIIVLSALMGSVVASYLAIRHARRREASLPVDDESAVGASANREPAAMS